MCVLTRQTIHPFKRAASHNGLFDSGMDNYVFNILPRGALMRIALVDLAKTSTTDWRMS